MPASPRRYDLLQSRLNRLTKLSGGVEEAQVTAIHRARVASRRLRELIPLLQLGSDSTDKLGRRLRKLTRRLGKVRELDVLILLIDELQESGRAPSGALTRVKAGVQDARRRAAPGKSLGGEVRRISKKLGKVLAELEAVDPVRDQARPWRWAIDARVARRAAALKRAIDRAGAVYLAERLHAVRIATKKLRYGLELALEAGGMPESADLAALKRTQTLLGRMHDLQVLIDRSRHVQGSVSVPDVTVWRDLDALITSLENSCRRLHARYVRERTTLAATCDRLGSRAPAGRASARRAG
jgi:CHAD domain-containing protein